MILAGIVTYNPEIDRLIRNIESVKPQVDHILIVDNASQNQQAIKDISEKYGFSFIAFEKNKGLAGALNDIFTFAIQHHYEWVLTLDQDSVLPENYIEFGKRYFGMDNVGIITCGYVENNLGVAVYPFKVDAPYLFIERCITSAAIVRVAAYQKTDGYDEDLFVDYVDFDFAFKIRHAGYEILHMNDIMLNHELGDSKWVRFLFRKVRYTSHRAEREYYIARNITIFAGRYRKTEKTFKDRLSLIKHYLFVLLYDDEKKKKLQALKQGRKDGKKYLSHNRNRTKS